MVKGMASSGEAELKQRFFVERGNPKAAEGEWEVLCSGFYVDEALQDYDQVKDQLQHLLGALEHLHRNAQLLLGRRQSPGRQAIELRLQLGRTEAQRVRAFERALAKSAAVDQPSVIEFRRAVLGSRWLTPDEARAFISSPATQTLPRETFEEEGIPFLNHIALYRGAVSTPDGAAWKVIVEVDTPKAVFCVSSDETEEGVIAATAFDMPVLHETDGREVAHVQPGSLLDELRELGAWLSQRYPWNETDAVWFVLTGRPPRVNPLRCHADIRRHRHYSRAMITLEVEPWVSVETVERAYRFCQQQLLKGPGRTGDNRKSSEKSLAVFEFVVGQIDDHGNSPSWPKLLETWNRTHSSDWHFEHSDLLRQAFVRAKAKILHPSFNPHDSPRGLVQPKVASKVDLT